MGAGVMGGGMMGAGMMGKGGMANPQMMAMMGKGNPQMMGMMGAKGAMGPMGMNPQMMAMMNKGGPGMMPPQMMGMMGGKPGMVGMQGAAGGAMGMVRPMGMPQMPGAGGVPQPQLQAPGGPQQLQPQQAVAPGGGNAPLTAAALAAAPAGVQKQMLGEKLFPAISRHQPELAGKITGMMLEMDNSELLMLLESDLQLKGKVDEAMRVLEGSRAP